MTVDDRRAPDSLSAKLRELVSDDDPGAADGSEKLETDTGIHARTSSDEPERTGPKRPTDPPF